MCALNLWWDVECFDAEGNSLGIGKWNSTSAADVRRQARKHAADYATRRYGSIALIIIRGASRGGGDYKVKVDLM